MNVNMIWIGNKVILSPSKNHFIHKIIVKFLETRERETFVLFEYEFCHQNVCEWNGCCSNPTVHHSNVNQSKCKCSLCMCHVVCQDIEQFLVTMPHVSHCFPFSPFIHTCSFFCCWKWLIHQKVPPFIFDRKSELNFALMKSIS